MLPWDSVRCVCLPCSFSLHGSIGKETWPALTAVLAVIAAVIAVLPALRVLEIQEDSQRPRPTPYFDLTSRYDSLQLRVKNFGASIAYDVHLQWKTRPVDHKGNEIQSLDSIAVLMPQESVFTLVGTSHEMVRKLSEPNLKANASTRTRVGRNTVRSSSVASMLARSNFSMITNCPKRPGSSKGACSHRRFIGEG